MSRLTRRMNAVVKTTWPGFWRRWRAFRAGVNTLFSSIAMRLVAVVLLTGILAFGAIGGLTVLRLQKGLTEQAGALGQLSERQMADRLDAEAQLARARVESLGSEIGPRLRQIAQRADVVKAILSRNDVPLREMFNAIAKTSEFNVLIAFDESGRVVGANTGSNLLGINHYVQNSEFGPRLANILKDNNRSNPHGDSHTEELDIEMLPVFGLPEHTLVGHIAYEPVFDEFGDIAGALMAVRTLARREHTLENFTSLSNAGVQILRGKEIVSSAGPKGVTFSNIAERPDGLIHSDDGAHVARCVDYEKSLKVCTFADASLVRATQNQMYRIGAEQTQSLMRQFLLSSALTLAALVLVLLVMVRYSTSGLSDLSAAARNIASGDMDTKIAVRGAGEVRTLSVAFVRMLENLRTSMNKIRTLAFYDTVTELPNREKIKLDAPAVISGAQSGTLLFIDLDGFKSINDTFGHSTGDQLLRKVSKTCGNISSRPRTSTRLERFCSPASAVTNSPRSFRASNPSSRPAPLPAARSTSCATRFPSADCRSISAPVLASRCFRKTP